MSISKILKGAGKAVGKDDGLLKRTFRPKGHENRKGVFQKLEGKKYENRDNLVNSIIPYHIANQYSIPVAVGAVGVVGAVGAVKGNNKAKMGTISAGDGLSNMTQGTIGDASANVVTPYLKQLTDNSSEEASNRANQIRSNYRNNISNSGADAEIIFALHNMR